MRSNSNSPADALRQYQSPGSANIIHVVVVMDGLKEFTAEPLRWALENIKARGAECTVTLLGAMPWLNIPLSSMASQDIWTVEFEELDIAKQRGNQWRNVPKYVKLQAVLDLCNKFGVVPQKDVVMGFPLRLIVLERIISHHATWVVFDRHQKKNREFFAERIPCKMFMMNESGEFDSLI